jgi:hypothetical protein
MGNKRSDTSGGAVAAAASGVAASAVASRAIRVTGASVGGGTTGSGCASLGVRARVRGGLALGQTRVNGSVPSDALRGRVQGARLRVETRRETVRRGIDPAAYDQRMAAKHRVQRSQLVALRIPLAHAPLTGALELGADRTPGYAAPLVLVLAHEAVKER